MFTKKSLIPVFVLLLALAGAGTIKTFAASAAPTMQNVATHSFNTGTAAIPTPNRNNSLLRFSDVRRYLEHHGIVGCSTLSGLAPTIQYLRLTQITNLKSQEHIFIPNTPGRQQVYYAQMKGPFIMSPHLSLPTLRTLLPSLANLPILSHVAVDNLLGLNGVLSLDNQKNVILGTLANLIGLINHPQPASPINHPQPVSHPPLGKSPLTAVLQTAYEVFDAHTGNLLAWG